MQERARTLVGQCQERIGEGLRAVYLFGPDERTVVYTREDIAYGYTDDRLFELLEGASEIHETLSGLGTELEPLGGAEASVLAFEHAFVVLFFENDHGVAIAVDRDVGPEIATFLDTCRDVLRHPS